MLEPILTDGTETGSSAAIKINNGFAQTDTNLNSITLLTDRVSTNETNITTNTSNITTNYNEINTLKTNDATQDTNIAALMDRYDYQSTNVTDKSTTDDNYASLVSLEKLNCNASDVRNVTISLIYNLDTIDNHGYFRFSFDDGVSWNEWTVKVDNTNDHIPVTYTVPYSVANDTDNIKVLVEYKVESAGDTLTVDRASIIIDRKV